MWTYDYFNQYIALINEFNIERNKGKEKRRKVFISREYYKNKIKEEKRKQFFEGIIKKVNKNKFISCGRISDSCNAFLEYKFEIVMPNKAAKDDINKKILANIMESYIVICDITPEKKNGIFVFNANVMAELGIALAWKTPEQVIILWDTSKRNKNEFMLPFNIKGYFINKVNFRTEKDKIIEIIKSRKQDIKVEKSIIVRNIIGKLDKNSLQILEKNRGLTFVVQEGGYDSKEHAIRHLLNLGLIKTEIFPLNPPEYQRTYAYQLTELARVVLDVLNSREIFNQRFADFMHIYHWSGHKAHKEKKLKDFFMDYKIPWAKCDSILKNLLKAEKAHFQKDGNVWPAFDCFCNGKSFDVIKESIVSPWNTQVDSSIKSDNKKKN